MKLRCPSRSLCAFSHGSEDGVCIWILSLLIKIHKSMKKKRKQKREYKFNTVTSIVTKIQRYKGRDVPVQVCL